MGFVGKACHEATSGLTLIRVARKLSTFVLAVMSL